MDTKYKIKIPFSKIQAKWYTILVARRIGKSSYFTKPAIKPEETYSDICRKRYQEAFIKCNKQFNSEIEILEKLQPDALSVMRFHRMFSVTTLWPRLHSRREIETTLNRLDNVLCARDHKKLRKILDS